ncbi:MAG: hypothetical protein N3A68_02375 [Bacteroidia bacterium]|nr:hypothetical protein [Bacteroidia bacterium]
MFRFLGSFLLLAVGWAQDLRSAPRCSGPECAERLRVEEKRPARRVRHRAEARVDRFGRPKPSRRAERFRFPVYTPRHKPMDRWEAFRPYAPTVPHPNRAERFRLFAAPKSHRSISRAEGFRPRTADPSHRPALVEKYRPPLFRPKRSTRQTEKARPPSPAVAHVPPKSERIRVSAEGPRHRLRAEKFLLPLALIPHFPRRAEKQRFLTYKPSHQPTPEKPLYKERPIRHRASSRDACSPPPIPHHAYAEALACTPPKLRRRNFDRYRCASPGVSHRPKRAEGIACLPPAIKHRNFDRYSCAEPVVPHRPARAEAVACRPPVLRHRNFDRYTCATPTISHRSPAAYDVPCDAQKKGVMTATERLAHDLRYLFTNHKKHCDLVSAYSGFTVGEWINTRDYGRVPVAGIKMGWRVYVFAHFYDRKGYPLKKPRLEKRKVWAVKQIEVWVAEPASDKGKNRRYIKGLPGIEGFGELAGMVLVRKRLSVEETKAIQIEKLIRKRQIAWLVRAYPEERVRLPEWLKKYAGPKPAHFWPGVDYRLLEIW